MVAEKNDPYPTGDLGHPGPEDFMTWAGWNCALLITALKDVAGEAMTYQNCKTQVTHFFGRP